MNVFDFNGLSEKQQLDTLEETGVFIAERQRPFYDIKLYQLEGFYVELYYHTHFNVIVNVNCFSNTDCLEPYLQSIDLDALIDAWSKTNYSELQIDPISELFPTIWKQLSWSKHVGSKT